MNLLSSLLKYTADQIAALRAKDTNQDTTVSGINTRLTTAEGDIDSLEAQFTTVVSAVTTDTEVTNIRVGDDGATYNTAGTAVRTQFANVKADLNKLLITTEATSEWTFSTTTNSSIQNTIRFSASVCEISGRLKSVSIKMRNEDSGSISLCLAEVVGTTATVYAVIPITLHSNPATNIEYVNGADFTYSNDVRANTIFGIWSDASKQINYGTETVKSYATSTETPLNKEFSITSPNNYNVAVSFDVVKTEPVVAAEEVDEIKDEISALITEETIQSSWSFSTTTNAGILNTVRFSASICAEESTLESVSIKVRSADSGSVSICLAEVNGTTATIYAVIPITLHANPHVNTEYINGTDFEYSNKVRANTIFGVWADHSVQVNYGTETVKSYGTSTESPNGHSFSISSQNNYNVAVAFKASVKVPKVEASKKIVVFGDSWTDIVNTTYTRWPVLVNQLDEFDVTSYGVTGSNVSSHVATQVSNFLSASADADVFIIMGGINDYRSGVTASTIITAVEGYYTSLKEAYPNARIIYLANNQLFFTTDQLKYFNTIVAELRRAGMEAHTMFGWVYPNQYATSDLLHVGNAGNVLIANNILSLLRGGGITTVINKAYFLEVVDNTNAGLLNIFEEWNDGFPTISANCLCTSKLANTTVTRTINSSALTLSVSASYALYPCSRVNRDSYLRIYTPLTETLDGNKQVTEFVLTFVVTSAGDVFVTPNRPLWYGN